MSSDDKDRPIHPKEQAFAYSVRATAGTDEEMRAFRAWLEGGHLEDVCCAGAESAELVVLGPRSLEVRYRFASSEAFVAYERDAAPRLRSEGQRLFPTGITMERSGGSIAARVEAASPTVEVIPVGRDNYAYALTHRGETVIIDPTEAGPVLAHLRGTSRSLTAIWCTHHHGDHVGGVPGIVQALGPVPVFGSETDRRRGAIPNQTHGLEDGATVHVGGLAFRVLEVPGHTLGSIAFRGLRDVFVGDTLFLGGCGRLFEGTHGMLRASLERLRDLPPAMRVWAGHEYTESNLAFAATVEPTNARLETRVEAVRAMRKKGSPTMPGSIGEERATNPMLRWDSEGVQRFAASRGAAATPDAVFARVREAKDAW